MSLHQTLFISVVLVMWLWVEASRFSRNEARCAVVCMNKDSEECRICNTRIPMRFGKRNNKVLPQPAAYLYDLNKMSKPDIRLLALVEGDDAQDLDSDEK